MAADIVPLGAPDTTGPEDLLPPALVPDCIDAVPPSAPPTLACDLVPQLGACLELPSAPPAINDRIPCPIEVEPPVGCTPLESTPCPPSQLPRLPVPPLPNANKVKDEVYGLVDAAEQLAAYAQDAPNHLPVP